MYTHEQLGPPTASQKQTFFLNLRELYEAGVHRLPLAPGEELAFHEELSEGAMTLSKQLHEINDYGQSVSIITEISVSERGELVKYIDPELSELHSTADIGTSDEVADYQEMIELLQDNGGNVDAVTRETYDTKTRALAANFTAVSGAELSEYISLTDDLIDCHIRARRNWPAAN